MAAAALLAFTAGMIARAQSKPAAIQISGSSTVFPITGEAIRGFKETRAGKEVRFDLKETGTSAGFRDFCAGKVPISNASRPISSKELKACDAKGIKFIELPIAFDAVTVVVNPRNSWARTISTEQLSLLWNRKAQGVVNRWNQVNSAWPASPIKLCGPGEDSGTFDYFTEVVNGKAKVSRSDYTSSEDDNTLVQGVSQDEFGFGYVPFAYYEHNTDKLRDVALKTPKGQLLLPTTKSIAEGSYTPFSRPIFIYVSSKALEKPEVSSFVSYYLKNVTKLSAQVNYVALPAALNKLVYTSFEKKQTGSLYPKGEEIGLNLEMLLKKNTRQ